MSTSVELGRCVQDCVLHFHYQVLEGRVDGADGMGPARCLLEDIAR